MITKEKNCASRKCRQPFTPQKRGLRITKHCCAACELDDAEAKGLKPKKVKPKKQKTAAQLKKILWPIFSLHQKLVHSVDGKWCNCYTCDAPIEIGSVNNQGGHCLSKAVYKNLYFDERSVRPQCLRCNLHLGGMHYDRCEKLKQEIGVDEFNHMRQHGKDVVKRDSQWYLEQIAYYTRQCEIIREAKQ